MRQVKLGDLVGWQFLEISRDRNTKAQKDKGANRYTDIQASKFNLFVYPITLSLAFMTLFFVAVVAQEFSFNLALLAVFAIGLGLLAYHCYWAIFFDGNYQRGAQRWRFHFFMSDVLVALVTGILLAIASLVLPVPYYSTVIIALVVVSVLVVENFAPYSRVLLTKLSFLWGPIIFSGFYLIFITDANIIKNSVSPVACCFLYIVLMHHAKVSSKSFWKIRESEYLIRLKAESYQAAHHAEKANSKNDSEFIAAYSQELKIHLDSLLSGVHLLKDTPVSLQQKELIDTTEQAGEKTINLIDTVNDYSRSKQKIIQSELVIFPIVRDFEELFVAVAREGYDHGIDTNFIFDKHLPQRIKADKNLILKVLSLLLSCMNRLNVSGRLLITTNYHSLDSSKGVLNIILTDVIEDKDLEKTHPLIEKLVTSSQLNGAVALNYLMAENFAKQLNATVNVSSGGEHAEGVGIEVEFPVEAKSGSTPEFYPNANLKDKYLAIVNCPEKIKSYVLEQLSEWGLSIIFFAPEEFINTPIDSEASQSSTNVDDQKTSSESIGKLLNNLLKEKNVESILWFAEVSDDNIFDGKHSIVKKAIFQHDHLSSRPVFVVATDRQIQSSLHRQFLHEQPNIHAIQKPLQLQQFHHILVDALFNVDFHAHHVLNKLFSLDDGGERERILLVEDHRVNQMVAEGMLKRLGYTTKIANNGAEALNMLEEQEFDLILMDCQMAEMDGFTATEAIRIKEKSTDKHIPIIALTANTTEEDQNKCLAVGMDDYLSKPVRYSDLEHSLKRWLDDGGGSSIHH
ncbi:MAG: response regulator [Cellvibrionaceae bacterium]